MAVLDAGINRLRDIRRTSGAEERATQIATLALDIQQRVHGWLQKMGSQFEQRLREGARPAGPGGCAERRSPDERARWWRRQVVETANSVDFYANLQDGCGGPSCA